MGEAEPAKSLLVFDDQARRDRPLYPRFLQRQERRQHPRIDLSQAIRIRPFDPSLPPEYCTTSNASEDGLYFPTEAGHYALGMSVYVTTDFQLPVYHPDTGHGDTLLADMQ